MPELPEVEITRRHLDAVMRDRRLAEVEVRHPRTARYNSGPVEVERRLAGRIVSEVQRTGKFLHAPLDDGQTLVAHLGMSGRFTVNGPEEKHTHFVTVLDDGTVIRFIDPRTFGFVSVLGDLELQSSGLARLGPDALATPMDAGRLRERLSGRTAPIKALLLDQRLVSGLGNIYADEALHRAGIHPMRSGGSLSASEINRLTGAITLVLAVALENGGTSLDDLAYLLPDGRAGENLESLRVYGRTDLPCPVCGSPVRRVAIRGRSSHFCPSCQRPPDA